MTAPIKNPREVLPELYGKIQEYTSKMQDQAGVKDTTTFDTLLKDAIASAPALGKEHIQLLLFKMRMQMNDRLFHAVRDDKKDTGLMSPFYGLMNSNSKGYLSEPTTSKKLHQPQKNDTISPTDNIDMIISQAAERFSVDPDLIRGVIKAESNFKVHSTSPKGAMGLMQLMPGTAQDLGVKDPYDPYENVMGGTRYLKGLLDRYGGNVDRALAAYNWGMGNVEKHPDRLPRETITYISRIKQYYFEAKA
jgi:hypothetical protein